MTFPSSSATVAGLGITQTFTGNQTITPASDGAAFRVRNSGNSYNIFSIDTSGVTTSVTQDFSVSRLLSNSTSTFQVKNASSSVVFGVDTTNGILTSATTATVSGTALSTTNKVVDAKGGAMLTNSGVVTAPSGTYTTGILVPAYATTTYTIAAGSKANKFLCPIDFTVTGMRIVMVTQATTAWNLYAAIFASDGSTRLTYSNTSSIPTTGTSAGIVSIPMLTSGATGSTYTLTGGTTYYAVIGFGNAGSSSGGTTAADNIQGLQAYGLSNDYTNVGGVGTTGNMLWNNATYNPSTLNAASTTSVAQVQILLY